jgi:UDP-N-acetylmuramoyl-tripeptide--D-alanyl-D-alanine ligase
MASFDPSTLAQWTGGRWTRVPAAPTGFCVDSRRIKPGQAFVALRTEKRDGHDFLSAARDAGAACAIVSRHVQAVELPQLVVADPLAALQAAARAHRGTFRGPVVAITGSAGKTSTKELVALILGGQAGGVLATEANLNNQIGVALTLTRIDPAAHRFAVVEAGISAPGEMALLAAMISPDVAVVTLVGPAHLAELGGVEGVAREKAVLGAAVADPGACIFPGSCEAYAPFRALARKALVVEPMSPSSPRVAGPGRARFSTLHTGVSTAVSVDCAGQAPLLVTLRRVSDGMAQNVAMAVCAGLRLGIPREDIQRRLLAWRPSPLRGEWRNSEGRLLYLDCYNANPASMADALGAFNAEAPAAQPRLYLLGCMEELGAQAHRYHVDLGRSLRLRPSDHAFVVGSLAAAVRQGAIDSGCRPAQVEVVGSVGPMSARLASFKGAVFVKGSRRYELEKALSGSDLAEVAHA